MASTEDTAATGAAAAAANTAGGMHTMYAQAVEQYEANVAAASTGETDGEGQASGGKPSNSAAPTDKPKKSRPRGHMNWKLLKELPSPEGEANPWNRTEGAQPVSTSQLQTAVKNYEVTRTRIQRRARNYHATALLQPSPMNLLGGERNYHATALK